MNYRVTEIMAQKTLASSGVELIDINVKDPISMLLFEYKNTRGSTTSAKHVANCLSKIELIDGSDVLFSLSGRELQALDYYDKGKSPYTFLTNIVGVMQLLGLNYNFGRFLYDPVLAFDPTRFTNPQLKITHNRVVCDASSSAHYLRVLGFLFDEKVISPIGFLSSREIKSYTSPADGTIEYTDLPVDRVIRKMLIEAYDEDYFPWQCVHDIKLSEDHDKRVPFDEPTSLLMKWMNNLYPRWVEYLKATLTTSAIDFYVTPNWDIVLKGCTTTQGGILDIESSSPHVPFKIGSNGSYEANMEISGFLPHAVLPLPFGDQQDIDDWYDVTKLGSLRASLTGGAAGTAAEIKLFLQQLRRY